MRECTDSQEVWGTCVVFQCITHCHSKSLMCYYIIVPLHISSVMFLEEEKEEEKEVEEEEEGMSSSIWGRNWV